LALPLNLKERVVHFYLQEETTRTVAETFEVFLGFVHHVDLYRRYWLVADHMPHPAVDAAS
jgi:hypothetical protein